MTVAATPRRAGPFPGNGVTTALPFTFKAFSSEDVRVDLTDGNSVTTTLVLGSGYSLSLNPDQETTPGGTATLSAPLAIGNTAVVIGGTPFTQALDLPSGGRFNDQTIEQALDRLVFQTQQLAEGLSRAALVPTTAGDASGLNEAIVVLSANLTALTAVADNIAALVSLASALGDVSTLAALDTEIAALAAISGNIIAVAAIAGDVSALAAIAGDVSAVADNIANINAAVADLPSLAAKANAGPVTASTLTMATDRVLGRVSALTGAIEELTRAQLSVLTTFKVQPISASVAANALTLTLNPTTLDFRSATLGSGAVNTRTIATAISLVISSGSTLGTISAQASRVVVIAIDNAGTVELAAVNLAGGVNLDETGLISTTAEGGAGAADSATVVYSATARTNVPYRVIGYVESTQATAGTWVTAPSAIAGAGGQVLAAMQSLGFTGSYQLVTRTAGVTYYNTTGKPLDLVMNVNGAGSASCSVSININGTGAFTFLSSSAGTGPSGSSGSVRIPPGASYVLAETNVTSRNVYELR